MLLVVLGVTWLTGLILASLLVSTTASVGLQAEPGGELTLPYCVVDTGQKSIFSDQGQLLKTRSQASLSSARTPNIKVLRPGTHRAPTG